jgi:molecular chaperone DnaJ
VPPGTSSGKKLRLKGQGVQPTKGSPGDLLAEIQIVLPPDLAADDREQLESILSKYSDNPRADLRW